MMYGKGWPPQDTANWAFPLDVSDGGEHGAVGRSEDVVEVAAHLSLAGRPVPGAHLEPLDPGQLLWQQALLQRPGHVGPFLVQAGVVEGLGGPGRQLLG